MTTNEKQGLQKRSTLVEAEILEIVQLIAHGNAHDKLHVRIPLEALRKRSGDEIGDFLYYDNGTLVGYLFVDNWGKKEKEFTGIVAPEMRRHGIFTRLFEAAREECKARGVERMILISEHHSHSGQAFAKAIKARYDFSEHEMVLGNFVARGVTDPQFQMRLATPDDRQSLISILETSVGDEEDASSLVDEAYQDSSQQIYLATLAGKPLGALRVYYQDESIGIYGFLVRPEYRRKGYGRQMLEDIIRRLYDEGVGVRRIMLEVETTNHKALNLYRSCGFEITTTYDYFDYDIR
jgi:ribosomal protein S18 acetylase RimI-like enzyme